MKAGSSTENRTEHAPNMSLKHIGFIRCLTLENKNKGIETELGQNWAVPAEGFSSSMITLNIPKNANNLKCQG
jgi:hypothetical protein